MKAILEFNLDDPQDAERHRRCMKADDMANVLYDLCNKDDVPNAVSKEVQVWCDEFNIDFEEILT